MSDRITINAGGRRFETSTTTLVGCGAGYFLYALRALGAEPGGGPRLQGGRRRAASSEEPRSPAAGALRLERLARRSDEPRIPGQPQVVVPDEIDGARRSSAGKGLGEPTAERARLQGSELVEKLLVEG